MRTLPLLLISLAAAVSGYGQNNPVAARQVAPVPQNPLELVTGPTKVAVGLAERQPLLAMLNRAVAQSNPHLPGAPAHVLRISFNAAASTLYQGGSGTLRETWVSDKNWRWDGSLPGYSLLRISSNGAVFDQNAGGMLPMRMKMLIAAVFAPLGTTPRRAMLRTASATRNGSPVACILTSAQSSPQGALTGRQWYEQEYCVDPASGLLQTWSAAPGIYATYDYSNALRFHGLTLPGKVSISENGATVLDAQLTGIADANPSDTSPFTPTAQMISQSPARLLGGVERFPVAGPAPSSGAYVQPVIVHAIIDEKGNVVESEALQTSSLSAAALDYVNMSKYGQKNAVIGSAPVEREAFINVRFRPSL